MSDNAQTILDAGERLAGVLPRVQWFDHGVAVALTETRQAGSVATRVELMKDAMDAIDERAKGPRRRVLNATLHDEKSFIAYLVRWGSTGESVVYADLEELSFQAVLDDNPADPVTAAWRSHRAVYACPGSSEWKIWCQFDGKNMTQSDFGDFLESRLEDLRAAASYPAPTEVLQVARQLMIRTKGTFERQINPTTGDSILVNKSETDPGSTQIPRAFLINIPVFDGGQPYEIQARVRFSLNEGKPVFCYSLHRRNEIQRDAFDSVRTRIAEGTKMLVLAGEA